jgi:hypothetical protein
MIYLSSKITGHIYSAYGAEYGGMSDSKGYYDQEARMQE